MTMCDFSLSLKIIMYLKYIFLFLYLFLCIYYIANKNKRNNILLKILKFSTIIIFIYIFIGICLYFTNINLRKCFINSNPIRVSLSEKLTDTYNSNNNVENTDLYIDSVDPDYTRKLIGGNDIKIYNQNTYPLSNYNFNFSESANVYSFKKSGTEITTLATAISSLPQGDDSNPIKILEYLRYSGVDFNNEIDMNKALSILSKEYSFLYKNINYNEIIGGLKNGGIVIAKVSGSDNSTIFTCSNSYIIIYNYDSSSKFSVLSVNDKNYNFICPIGTQGFGNIIKSNINDTLYSYDEITSTINTLYLLWR